MLKPLIEIPRTEWHYLRDIYSLKKKDPSAFGLLQNYISWIKKEPNLNIKIYSAYDDWRRDGAFVLIDYEMEPPHVYLNTLSNNFERLYTMLNCLSMQEKYFLSTMPKRHFSVVKEHLYKRGYDFNETKHFGGNWYVLPKEEALNFSIKPPAGITLSTLKAQHAEKICSIWPLRCENSIKYIRKLIDYNENIGAFDSNQQLVGWCLRTPLGALGNVQVMDTHQRLGLGSLLVRHMSKLLALKNEQIMAPIKYENVASRSMFEKLGFNAIDEVFCVEVPDNFDYYKLKY